MPKSSKQFKIDFFQYLVCSIFGSKYRFLSGKLPFLIHLEWNIQEFNSILAQKLKYMSKSRFLLELIFWTKNRFSHQCVEHFSSFLSTILGAKHEGLTWRADVQINDNSTAKSLNGLNQATNVGGLILYTTKVLSSLRILYSNQNRI